MVQSENRKCIQIPLGASSFKLENSVSAFGLHGVCTWCVNGAEGQRISEA